MRTLSVIGVLGLRVLDGSSVIHPLPCPVMDSAWTRDWTQPIRRPNASAPGPLIAALARVPAMYEVVRVPAMFGDRPLVFPAPNPQAVGAAEADLIWELRRRRLRAI